MSFNLAENTIELCICVLFIYLFNVCKCGIFLLTLTDKHLGHLRHYI